MINAIDYLKNQIGTLNSTSPQMLYVQNGPLMVRTVCPEASLTLNLGLNMDHSCWIEPIKVPGGDVTSNDWKPKVMS